jgi:isoleucyl-tRNA synthetase
MFGQTLRQLAVTAIGEIKWYPPRGQTALAMVKAPRWVLSRQRAWGVPLAIFVEKKSGQILNDAAVFKRIERLWAEGADAWFTSPASRFLGEGRNPDDYEQVTDILMCGSIQLHHACGGEPHRPPGPRQDARICS